MLLHFTWINSAARLGVISFKVSLTLKKHVVCRWTVLSTKNGHKAVRPDCCWVCTGQPSSVYLDQKTEKKLKDFNNSILTRSRCKTLVDWANFCVGTKLSECMFQSGSLKSVTLWWASWQTPHSWEPRRHPCPPRWSFPPPPPPSACHLKNFRSPSLALHYLSKATKNIKFSQGRICWFTNKSAR